LRYSSLVARFFRPTSAPDDKAKTSDTGVHVPLIVSAPMLSRGGRVTAALTDFTDLFPTFAELAQAKIPAGLSWTATPGARLEGKSEGDRNGSTHNWRPENRTRPAVTSSIARALLRSANDPSKRTTSAQCDAQAVAARQRLAKALGEVRLMAPPFDGYPGVAAGTPKENRARNNK